jgi:uncharacterized protein (TIGR03435 family)
MKRKRNVWMSAWACLLICVWVGASVECVAQAAAKKPLEFEAASVRKSAPGARPRGWNLLSPMSNEQPRSGLLSVNAHLSDLIRFSYDIKDGGIANEMRKTLPEWAGEYDIAARAEGIPTRKQLREMMRQLLLERFKLRAHYETRKLPVKIVRLAKPGWLGPGITVHPADQPCGTDGKSKPCGVSNGWDKDGRIHVAMIDMDMDRIIGYLGAVAGKSEILVDKTGLHGDYDAHLEYILEVPEGMKLNHPAPSGQLLDEAIEKQFGFKMVKGIEPVRVLVIDHVEPPSGN